MLQIYVRIWIKFSIQLFMLSDIKRNKILTEKQNSWKVRREKWLQYVLFELFFGLLRNGKDSWNYIWMTERPTSFIFIRFSLNYIRTLCFTSINYSGTSRFIISMSVTCSQFSLDFIDDQVRNENSKNRLFILKRGLFSIAVG